MTITNLPTHPRTGLTALGLRRDGVTPIWPVMGGDGTTEPPPVPPAPAPPATTPPATPPAPPNDEPLGEPGKKALDEERKKNRELEKELAGHRKAAQDKADADKSEAEKRAAAEERATQAELRAARLEVAAEKGLTPAQARRLVGTTKEELEADADQILIDFPVAPATTATPPVPKPDPSQGSKGTPPAARAKSLGEAVGNAYKKA
jgi:hypothetical protein